MDSLKELIQTLEDSVLGINKKESVNTSKIRRHKRSISELEEKNEGLATDKAMVQDKILILDAFNDVYDEFRAVIEKTPIIKAFSGLLFDSAPSQFLQELGVGAAKEILEMTPDALLAIFKQNSVLFKLIHKKLVERGYTFKEKKK